MVPPIPPIHSSHSSIQQFLSGLKIAKKKKFKIVNINPPKSLPSFVLSSKAYLQLHHLSQALFLSPLQFFHQYYCSLSLCFQVYPTFPSFLPEISSKWSAIYARLKRNCVFTLPLHSQERYVSEQLLFSLLKPILLIRFLCLGRLLHASFLLS